MSNKHRALRDARTINCFVWNDLDIAVEVGPGDERHGKVYPDGLWYGYIVSLR